MEHNGKTYWGNEGVYQDKVKALQGLIPNGGKCVGFRGKNKNLDKFRRASNVYYDLYNNGLANRAREFKGSFGFAAEVVLHQLKYVGFRTWENSGLENKIEDEMDSIIKLAWEEQVANREC